MKTKTKMKPSWKIFLCILGALFIIGATAFGVLMVKGYEMYKEAVAETPIEGLMDDIRARPGEFVTVDELPQMYIDAVITAEDRRFYTHDGIDVISIARAVLVDIKTMSFAEGGSTITQQLAKNELFTQRKHLERKFAEIFAARAIEDVYTKDEIFEMYVNSIYFGSGYYGISNAALGYFEVEPSEMSDLISVFLAGLPNAPSVYSPNNSVYLATRRMTVVLQRMINYDVITVEKADQLMAEAYSIAFLCNYAP